MNADRVAASYRWIEYAAFGSALEEARFDFLPRASTARRVLILGEGDGRFLARLLGINRQASIVVVETSSKMLRLAKRRVSPSARSRVEFHQIDATAQPLPAGEFDLAVSHFFLDVFDCPQASAVISKVNALLSPGAVWLVSEFQQPPSFLRGLHARVWLRAMYAFFALTTGLRATQLPPYRDLLTRNGFTEMEHRERRFGLIRSQVWRKAP
jgi:ubiquinone/menaquinone biosynthesis C-methylase UbiE